MACREVGVDFIEIPKNAAFTSRQACVSNELRNNQKLTDFTIISEGQRFPCHSIILASSSTMFLAMFEAAMQESTKRETKLPDVPPDVVKIIIEYIYLGTVKVPSHLLLDTIKAANFLDLMELKVDCVQRAHLVLQPSNAISWHKLAHKLQLEDMEKRCSEMLSTSLVDIAKGSEFQMLLLPELTSYLHDMQASDVDNDDKLDAVITWTRRDPDLRSKDMSALVQHIEVSRCSIQCIEETMKDHKDLFQMEMYRVFADSLVAIAKQDPVRRKRHRKKTMLVVIAGHEKTCWQCDESMTLTELCKGLECSKWFSACEVPRGFILTGGIDSVICMMYVASLQSWIQLTSLKTVRFGHSSVFLDGQIFVLAGLREQGDRLKSVHSLKLDDDDGEWMDEPDLPIAAADSTVACFASNIYMLDVHANILLCLDSMTKVWKEKAKCPAQRVTGTSMISIADQLLVAGGNASVCACYTPASDTWITCSSPSLKHRHGALIWFDDKIYLIGGNKTEKAEEYDMASDTWSVCHWKLPERVKNLQAVKVDAP